MSADSFKDLYDKLADRKGEANNIGPYAGGNGRIDRAVELINTEFKDLSGTLVDIGGATGNLGYALRNRFSERYVVEIAEVCKEPAENKGNIFKHANVDQNGIPVELSSVNLITALDLIEHILDPEKFARNCFKALKSGGKVLINTPNIQYWRHLHSLVVEGHFPHTSGDNDVYHGGHIGFYNVNDLVKIFGDAGFKNHKVHTLGLTADPPPPIWTAISKVNPIDMSYADLVYSAEKP